RSQLAVLTPAGGTWSRASLAGVPEFAHTDIADTDPYDSDEYMLVSNGFTEPDTLIYGQIGGASQTLKRAPAFFDATGMSVRQFFATSADVTLVPYFVVGPDHPGPRPTLLTGYGGFEVSLTPSYSGIVGRGLVGPGGNHVVGHLPRRGQVRSPLAPVRDEGAQAPGLRGFRRGGHGPGEPGHRHPRPAGYRRRQQRRAA